MGSKPRWGRSCYSDKLINLSQKQQPTIREIDHPTVSVQCYVSQQRYITLDRIKFESSFSLELFLKVTYPHDISHSEVQAEQLKVPSTKATVTVELPSTQCFSNLFQGADSERRRDANLHSQS